MFAASVEPCSHDKLDACANVNACAMSHDSRAMNAGVSCNDREVQ